MAKSEINHLKREVKMQASQLQLPWTDLKLIENIGDGGNGTVWKCSNQNGEFVAVKFLSKINKSKYKRFKSEIEILESIKDVSGVIPILRKHLPEDGQAKIRPCFEMPLAVAINNNMSIDDSVDVIIKVAETLITLHNMKISHRDIKPANILLYKEWCLSDFGLADWPQKQDITQNGEAVGAKWTIAPEMRRVAKSADGLPADVYSLAKTLWILLTKRAKGFDGQYDSGVKN